MAHKIAARSSDHALRARLFDIVWETQHPPEACRLAAEAYLERARASDTDEDWILAVPAYNRALHLASHLGIAKPLYQTIGAAVVQAAKNASIAPISFRAYKLMNVLLRARTGDPAEFAAVSEARAIECESKNELSLAKHYREMEAEWKRIGGDQNAAKQARLAAGEIAVKIAEARLAGPRPGALAASSLLIEAIEILRQAGAPKERVADLRRRLGELQAESMNEMQTFSFTVDIGKEVEAAREHVRGRNFDEALLRFALGLPLVDVASLRAKVTKAISNAPLSHFIDAQLMDDKGRTIAKEPGVFGKTGAEQEQILEGKMFAHAARFRWQPQALSFIEPARKQILTDHQPTFDHLVPLVQNNPFVPQGHEMIFLRGIHAGLHGDYLVALHLLVPQIENSVRHILETRGVDVSNLESDGTQPVKMLGALLSMPQAKLALGESLLFELRGHFIEKSGFDFRNKVAHGFLDDDDCYSRTAIAVWWLILHTCVFFSLTGGADTVRKEKAPGK